MRPFTQIRARFDRSTIVVYQAYGHDIADAAVAAQRFVAPFSFERMTWVKPSFLWMMERCGWATKPRQERVLAVHLVRARFDALLERAVPTHFIPGVDPSPEAWRARAETADVRVQWDPERDVRGGKLNHRSLQLGIGRGLARAYATEWIARIEDVTALVHRLGALRREGEWARVERNLPEERPYP